MAVFEQRHHRAMMIDRAFGARQADAAPVNRNEVIIFGEGVHQDFPIARHVIAVAGDVAELVEVELGQLARQDTQILLERFRIGRGIDEYPAAPCFASQLHQAALRFVQPVEIPAVRYAEQFAVQIIGPGVVAADQPLAQARPLTLLHDAAATVRAGIVEGVEAIFRPHDDDRHAGDALELEKAADFGKLVLVPGIEPTALPEIFQFELIKFRRNIALGRDVRQWRKAFGIALTPLLIVDALLQPLDRFHDVDLILP